MKKLKQNRYYKFYETYFQPRRLMMLFLLLLIKAGVVSGNLNPFVYGKMIDSITAGDFPSVEKYIAIYFAVNLFAFLLGMLEGYVGQMVSYFISSDVRKRLFSKIMRMRFRNLDEYHIGELVSRLDSDAGSIVDFYIEVATSIILIVFNLIVSIYFVFSISVKLSLVSILFIPATVAVTIIFRKKFKVLEVKQKKYYDKYMTFSNETFSNIRGIRAYQLEGNYEEKFSGFISERLSLMKKSIRLSNSMALLKNLITTTFGLVIIYLSAKFIIAGAMTIGSLVAFNTYANKLFDAVSRILTMNVSVQGVAVSMDRIDELCGEADETNLYKGSGLSELKYLDVESVSFGYNDTNVLEKLSLSCKKPGLYAIVGKNGCGKSTIAKLIMGFYDSSNGAVKYGRKTKEEIGLKHLRNRITYIQKEVFIINDTLLNNIKIANVNASDKEIMDICDKIGFGDLVKTLADKYETHLGENGSRLSSGQKQKLSIARALLRTSDVILLDEVTSDLDGKAEKEILDVISELSKTKIVIFISHKVTSIINSDKIFLLESGKLADEGNHSELMNGNALYRELFWLQNNEGAEV